MILLNQNAKKMLSAAKQLVKPRASASSASSAAAAAATAGSSSAPVSSNAATPQTLKSTAAVDGLVLRDRWQLVSALIAQCTAG